MTESDDQTYVEWIAREARRPVVMGPAARTRIMDAVRAEPAPRRRFWHRLIEPRLISASPIASLALAAGLVGIGVFGGTFVNNRDGLTSTGLPQAVPALPIARVPVSDTVKVMTFRFIAPQAAKVSLVGDFNGWSVDETPMTRVDNGGVWSVTVPLSVGRHLYSFVVDSQDWIADPRAPVAPDDGFGHANSVVLVSRGSSS
jgi:hypothetical protein